MKKLFHFIAGCFKFLGKALSFIRTGVVNLALLIFIIMLLVPLIKDQEPIIQKDSALLLTLAGDIVEEKRLSDPFSDAINESIGLENIPSETLLQNVLDAIDKASSDTNITCIILDMKYLARAGLNQLHDIGKALDEFKSTGKKVIAAEDNYRQNQYYLATYADTIILNPMGAVDLHGFGYFRSYFKEALDKLQINYHVFRVGTYKSAIEPFVRNSMSENDRQQSTQWLTSLWKTFTSEITLRRKLPLEAIDNYSSNIAAELVLTGGSTAQLAVKSGFVDELKTREELYKYFVSQSAADEKTIFRHIKLRDYLRTIAGKYSPKVDVKDKIGIIVAQGNIVDGSRPPGTIGGDSLSNLIRKARTNPQIQGVVLRINSGGGSVFASEVIRQELLELKKSGKPYVVSMGSMAASGGYWIAADADEIWASETTLTGSIGIFGAIPTFENTLANMGVHRDGYGTTPLAAGLDISQPLSPLLKESIQLTLNHGYEKFIRIVENGRKIDRQQLDKYAQGRVFDGIKAQKIGLVDKIGNLEDAINATADLAGLDNFSPEYIQAPASFREKFLRHLGSGVSALLPENGQVIFRVKQIKEFFSPIKTLLLDFNDPGHIYAHCMIN
jgi:protease IV